MVLPLLPSAIRILRHLLHIGSTALGSATGIGCTLAGIVAIGTAAWWLAHRGPSPEERERVRRLRLAAIGRIIDGTVTEALPSERDPATILYEYRISGVTYECGQDVSQLRQYLGELRVDLPVQVRYDPYNPANSIVVAESWNGLWHWDHPAGVVGEDEAG